MLGDYWIKMRVDLVRSCVLSREVGGILFGYYWVIKIWLYQKVLKIRLLIEFLFGFELSGCINEMIVR